MAQKQKDKPGSPAVILPDADGGGRGNGTVPVADPAAALPSTTPAADIDRALEIVRSLPMLRRYGDDGEAMKEVCSILEAVKEKL